MLRRQNHHLCALRAASHAPASPLHRLHLSSAATAAVPPAQFVVEDSSSPPAASRLAPTQARRASKYFRHLKSPAKPDAIRAFLADAGIAKADIASAIAMNPPFLCCKVDNTLSPRVAQLRDMGLSPPQISRLVSIASGILHRPSLITRLEFYISLLGSYHKVEAALKANSFLLHQNIDNVVKPNMVFLQQCGLSEDDIAGLYLRTGKLFTGNLENLKKMVARAENLGMRRSSGMFKEALVAVCNLTPEKLSAKMKTLEKALGYPEAKMAVCKLPSILSLSEVNLLHSVEFLKTEFGLEPSYIARRPAILSYSLERRLIPRHYVIQILKAKGFLERDVDLYTVFTITHKKFVEKYLDHR